MATQENENYIRIILLLMEGGIFILKGLLDREIGKTQLNIDQHLLQHQPKLKHKVKAKKQYKKLFPLTGTTNIVTWDIDLLTLVIVQLFKSCISIDEWREVQLLRRLRQDVQAHASTASISNAMYLETKGHLENALNSISNGLSASQQKEIKNIISMATKDPLDIQCVIENLQRLTAIDDSLQDLNNKLDNIAKQMSENVENAASEFSALCQSIGTAKSEIHAAIKQEILPPLQDILNIVKQIHEEKNYNVVYEIEKKLTFSSTDENKALDAEETVFKLMKKAVNNVQDSVTNVAREDMKSEYSNIETTVRKIVSEIQKEDDAVIIKVKRKCILLTIQCVSYAGLLHLFNYSSSEKFHQDLDTLSVLLTKYFEIKIEIQATIREESFQVIVQESLDTGIEVAQKQLVISVRCQSVEGVNRIVDLFTNGGETNSLNQLSSDLSDDLQQQIHISTSCGTIKFMKSLSDDAKAKECSYSVHSTRQEAMSEIHKTNASSLNHKTLESGNNSSQTADGNRIHTTNCLSIISDVSNIQEIPGNGSGHRSQTSSICSKSNGNELESINSSNTVCKADDISVGSENDTKNVFQCYDIERSRNGNNLSQKNKGNMIHEARYVSIISNVLQIQGVIGNGSGHSSRTSRISSKSNGNALESMNGSNTMCKTDDISILSEKKKRIVSQYDDQRNIFIDQSSFYEQSCKLYASKQSNDFKEALADEKLIKFGIKLNLSFLNKFKANNPWMRHKPPIFQDFLDDKAKLNEKLLQHPKKYVRCKLLMEGDHEAICTPIDTSQTHQVIAISGRSNMGQTYNGDEVIVEIFDNKCPRETQQYGHVLCILNRDRYNNIKHPVFICTLDKTGNLFARPVCQTVPKIKLVQKTINKKPNKKENFKIEIRKYDEQAEILCDPKIIDINPENQLAHVYLVALINWDPRFAYPLGAIIKMIPWSSSVNRGLQILNLQHEVPTFYCKQTVDMMESIIKTIDDDSSYTGDRKDLTTINTFTIDPLESLVLSDALSIEKTSDGFKVGVHISDVTAFIKKGTSIDEEAYSRAVTFNPGIQHQRYMLPEPLSTRCCSLLPGMKRFTISVIFLLDKDCMPKQIEGKNFEIFLSVICSQRQFTYHEVQDIITKNETTDVIENDVKMLHALAEKIRYNRLGDSMFALDLSDIEETEDDNTLSDTPEAHYLVEEFMIMANQMVAQWLHKFYPTCIPVRCQPPPSVDALNNFIQRSNFFIHTLVHLQNRHISDSIENPSFQTLEKNPRYRSQKIIVAKELWEEIVKEAKVSEPKRGSKYISADDLHPLQHIIYQNWISIQERAEYRCSTQHITAKEIAHYSLEFDIYTHFTSPVQRYNDLIIHRMVHAALAKQKCPYEESEIKNMCIHFNVMSSKAKDYHKDCKAFQQAIDLMDRPQMVNCFVDEISDKGVTLCSPLMKYVHKTNRQLNFNLLDMGFKPSIDVDKNTEWNYAIATWRKRIYDLNCVPVAAIHENITTANTGILSHSRDNEHCVQLNAHKRVVFITVLHWVKMLKYALAGRFRELKRTIQQVSSELEHFDGFKDVTTFISDSQAFEPNTKFTMSFTRGQIVEIQMNAAPQQGMLAPKPVLYNMTNNVKLCLQHTDDPVLHLYHYSTRCTCEKYHNSKMYLERWLPLILMESATGVVQNEESYCVNNASVTFVDDKRGTFLLPLNFCEMRNIEISGISLDEDDNDTNNGTSYDWLCLKAKVLKQPNCKNTGIWAAQMTSDTLWIGHATVCSVVKVTDWQKGNIKNLMVTFDVHERSAAIPDEIKQTETKFNIEVLRKTEMDRRTENIIKQLPASVETLAEKIALNHPVPDLGEKYLCIVRSLKKKDLSFIKPTKDDPKHRPLPKNNTKQQEAISKSLSCKFSLIQGPPGTGKTHTGIKLIYLFNKVNGLLREDESSQKQVIYCGPSNTSVDLVAKWMLRRMGEYRPNFIRVYGGAIEAIDYPIPGRTFLSKRSTKSLKANEELAPFTLHHLIRKDGKPYSEKILRMEKQFKASSYVHDPAIVQKYINLVTKASIDEIARYDVILCTTMVASSPRVVKATSVNQLIIDEAGMCTEPQCMVPIIATKAEQVVLIGDHMQLRPIIKCKAAGELGLQKSLFERYAFTNSSKNVMFTMLEEQYRMDPKICDFPSNQFYEGKLVTRPGYWNKDKLNIWPVYNDESYPHVFVHVEGEEQVLTVSTEDGNEQSRSNAAELEQTVRIFRYLIDEGIDSTAINIMSQYNAQCAEIRRMLTEQHYTNFTVNTVVSSQGGEWDYVIFSTVRSLPEYKIEKNPTPGWCKQKLGFITDHNQINVALTRPRKGLIIIGNKNLLYCDDVWRKLIQYYAHKKCIKTPAVFPPSHRPRQEKMADARRRNQERFGSSMFVAGQPTSYDGSFDESRGSQLKRNSRASSRR